MKKTVLILLLVTASVWIAAEENTPWEWKDNFASTTYGIALLPVHFEGMKNGSSNTVYLPGLDIRLFNGKNISRRGGFFTGVEVGAIVFFSGDSEFEDSFTGDTSGTADYTVVNSDSFLGSVFALAKYGYRLDLGIKMFGVSFGWEMGIGARIASGNFDFESNIGGNEVSRSEGYETTAMSMVLDTAVEASIRIGTDLRFVGKAGIMLSPPLVSMDAESDGSGASTLDDGVSYAEAQDILDTYRVTSMPVFMTVRLGFILSY